MARLDARVWSGVPFEYSMQLSLGFAEDWNLNNEIVEVDLGLIAQGLGRNSSSSAYKNNGKRGKREDTILVSPSPLLDDEGAMEMPLNQFFHRSLLSSSPPLPFEGKTKGGPCYWRYSADAMCKRHIPLARNGFHQKELGDLLSSWQDKFHLNSHQYICSTGPDTGLLLTEDLAPLHKPFPEGTTAFIRLMPGSCTQKLFITVIPSSDAELLLVACNSMATTTTVTTTAIVWKTLPTSPFVRSVDFVLDNDQTVVCIPPHSLVAIRNFDRQAEAKIFYYTRLAVFPSLGAIQFVIHPVDSCMRQAVLFKASQSFMGWIKAALTTRTATEDAEKEEDIEARNRLIATYFKIQQCVAFARDYYSKAEKLFDWQRAYQDMALTWKQTYN